jgi:hypothetical protein
MRLLVTGHRRWRDAETVAQVLWSLRCRLTVVLHTGRPGAERIAAREARRLSVPVEVYTDATILTEGRPTYMYTFGLSRRTRALKQEYMRVVGPSPLPQTVLPRTDFRDWGDTFAYGPHC